MSSKNAIKKSLEKNKNDTKKRRLEKRKGINIIKSVVVDESDEETESDGSKDSTILVLMIFFPIYLMMMMTVHSTVMLLIQIWREVGNPLGLRKKKRKPYFLKNKENYISKKKGSLIERFCV